MTTIVGTPPGVTASGYRVTPPPIPTTGLQSWWNATDASTFSYSSGAIVAQWRDKSGSNRHLVVGASPATRDANINGVAACRFDQREMVTPVFASAFAAGEVFAVVQLRTDTNSGGFLNWTSSGTAQHYPFASDRVIYEPWGSTVRQTLGNPGLDLKLGHIYNVRSAPGSYIAAINGVQFFSTATNAVGFASTGNYSVGFGGAGSADINIGEIFVYNRVLTTPERQQVETYLKGKWNTP